MSILGSGGDPRNMSPKLGTPRDRATTTTARETFMSGKNSLSEHMGTKGSKATPGRVQGHGGGK